MGAGESSSVREAGDPRAVLEVSLTPLPLCPAALTALRGLHFMNCAGVRSRVGVVTLCPIQRHQSTPSRVAFSADCAPKTRHPGRLGETHFPSLQKELGGDICGEA